MFRTEECSIAFSMRPIDQPISLRRRGFLSSGGSFLVGQQTAWQLAAWGKRCVATTCLRLERTADQRHDPHGDPHLQADSPFRSSKVIPGDLSGVFL